MTEKTNENKGIPLWVALLPLLLLVTLLVGAVTIFGDDASYGPNQIGLMITAGFACIIGMLRGQSWAELEEAIVNGIMLAMKACLILLVNVALWFRKKYFADADGS